MKWPVKERNTFLKPCGGLYSTAVARPLAKLRLYVCQWAWLLFRLCCMMGAFLAICSVTFWTWMKWIFFPLNMFNAIDFNGNTIFVHPWPTEWGCSVKDATFLDASVAALNITCTDSGVIRFQVITALAASCSRWQFSDVETFKRVLSEREVSLMSVLQMCWCVP